MSDRKPTSVVLPWIAGIVLALLAAYVAAYYGNVTPRSETVAWRFTHHTAVVTNVKPEYAAPRSKGFFAPAHWLDRRIRSHVWEPTDATIEWNGLDFSR